MMMTKNNDPYLLGDKRNAASSPTWLQAAVAVLSEDHENARVWATSRKQRSPPISPAAATLQKIYWLIPTGFQLFQRVGDQPNIIYLATQDNDLPTSLPT